jgi:hypothetical protein
LGPAGDGTKPIRGGFELNGTEVWPQHAPPRNKTDKANGMKKCRKPRIEKLLDGGFVTCGKNEPSFSYFTPSGVKPYVCCE